MASILGGLLAPSSFMASPSWKPPAFLHSTHLASFPSSGRGNGRLALPFSDGCASSSLSASGSRKWAVAAAAAEVEAEEAFPPEPVEAQVALAVAADGARGEEVFAVVMIGSRQYIVFPGRFIYTQRLKGANVNDKIILSKVLLVGTKENAYIGQPIVHNAVVHAVVEEQGLDSKVIVFKYKRKKKYRRTIGHRQPNTRLRITGITGYHDFPADPMPVQ